MWSMKWYIRNRSELSGEKISIGKHFFLNSNSENKMIKRRHNFRKSSKNGPISKQSVKKIEETKFLMLLYQRVAEFSGWRVDQNKIFKFDEKVNDNIIQYCSPKEWRYQKKKKDKNEECMKENRKFLAESSFSLQWCQF